MTNFIKASEVASVCKEMYDLKEELVPCFIGAPGIGKTQGVYQFAKEIGVNVVTFILSNTVPSEVSGIRMPDAESKKMEVFDDLRMASLQDGDILFLDEILEAPPMIWSACLTLIQDRIMASGRKLPNVFIVAASNPVASPTTIPPSVRDRFAMFDTRFDWNDWCKYFQKKHIVRPYGCLKDRIQSNSNTYNILTPRKIEKLYQWLNQDPNDRRVQYISSLHDAVVADYLMKMVNHALTPEQQIIKAIRESNIDMPEGLEELSLRKMLAVLQEHPMWEEIQYLLSTTEYDTSEDETRVRL